MQGNPQRKMSQEATGSEPRPWKKDEDEKLTKEKLKNKHLSWQDIAGKEGLARSGKECENHWEQLLKEDRMLRLRYESKK